MALAPVVAAALTDHSSRVAILTIDGLDVLDQPGVTPGYGVQTASIELREDGPDGVSSLDFVIDDPNLVIATDLEGGLVRFHNVTTDYPVFLGFVERVEPRPESLGRQLIVHCVGIEIVLDWAKLAAITIPAGTRVYDAIPMLVAQTRTGLAYPLDVRVTDSIIDDEGSLTHGTIGRLANATIQPTALVIAEGTTLREGIRAVFDDVAR